jgi:hypothetical protein
MPKFHKQDILSHEGPEEAELIPFKILLEWTAVSRPFRKKDFAYYRTAAILIILISLICILAGQILLVAVVLSFGFLVYSLKFISPEDVHYRITTQGITIGDHPYLWEDLQSFWFSAKEGHKILNVLTHFHLPALLIIVLPPNVDEEDVKDLCSRFITYHEIAPKNTFDKWTDTLQRIFPSL